jgi:hypothetical protein
VESGKIEPYVMLIGSIKEVEEALLIVDRTVIYVVEVQDVLFALLSCYFVFNICYAKGTSNFFQFLEVILLDHPTKLSSAFILFRNALECQLLV